MMHKLRNYIGGEWRHADASLDNMAPARGEVYGTIPRSQESDVNEAVAAAKAAFPAWAATSTNARAAILDAVADRIEARADELALLECEDTGKPITTARNVDIARSIANFRFFAGAVRHQESSAHSMEGALNYTLRRPVGVAALITPWNLPLYLLSWKIAPALATGNTVVAKPSELTPMTAHALAEIMHDAGLPPGVLNMVHGLGNEVGAPLVAHKDVSLVSFTGGTRTGEAVAASAAPQFKKLSLELGGKNATIVFDDADFDAAVEGTVRAGFTNQGQVCLCGSRIFVQRGIFDAFVAAMGEKVSAMVAGDPRDPNTQIGALISAAHRDKVESYIALAREEGGTMLCGGGRPKLGGDLSGGYFVEPTVVTGLSPQCRTATEEIFGPVVTVHAFDTEAEVISLANDVRYGLAASVWTQHLQRAHRVSAALETGMVWVNTWLMRDLRVPFGGMKDSGVGREGGKHSIEFFTEARNICIALPKEE